MIGHDHPRVQPIVFDFSAIFEGGPNQLGNGGLAEEGGAASSLIEQAVDSQKGSTGSNVRGWEAATGRQAGVQAEGNEQGSHA